jgi:hypothetical protein
MTDKTQPEFDRSEPAHDRERFLDEFIHSLEHAGGYSVEEARAVIDAHGILPAMLGFDPGKPGGYPNGRLLTDHIVAHRLSMLSKGKVAPNGLKPHTDLLRDFPYLGTTHVNPDPSPV